MSYCVNCGVELDDSAKKCALCGAPVLNPYLDEPEEALPPPYPDRLALPEGTNRRYIAFLVSMVLLIPNLICGVANLLILDSGVWSAYIVSSSLLFWVFFIVPFLMEKPRPLVLWLLDTLAGHAVYLALLRGRLGAAGLVFAFGASADFGAFRHLAFYDFMARAQTARLAACFYRCAGRDYAIRRLCRCVV